jgi:hypothetical protein
MCTCMRCTVCDVKCSQHVDTGTSDRSAVFMREDLVAPDGNKASRHALCVVVP